MEFIKKNLSVFISLFLAVIAGLLVFSIIKVNTPTLPTVVAVQNLSVGDQITAGDVTVKNMPASAVPHSTFKSKDQVIGLTVVAGPIIQGDMVRSEHLSDSGSLYASLKTFAPQGWVAVELPPGAGAGMVGIRRGDAVDIVGEVGLGIAPIVKHAIVLAVPNGKDSGMDQFIVAVPPEYVSSTAEMIIRGKPVTVTLPENQKPVEQPVKKSTPAPINETAEEAEE